MKVKYAGIDRSGAGRAGSVDVRPAEFVQLKFWAGWKSLTVNEYGSPHVVGRIFVNPDTGSRSWWAEDKEATG